MWSSGRLRYRHVPGLPGSANAAIRQWESRRGTPGRVAVAVSVWSAHVYRTDRRWRPWEAEFTCACCGEEWARDTLEEAMAALPAGTASRLRVVVERLDDVLVARSHQVPSTPAELPWWRRLCTECGERRWLVRR
ncbi:hypothetical protein [Streptomyces sp. SID3343]|uniref:hypothetical protein n=1 Tax=Streptomyces sp. SID3343 TaxID=2690260 RepID=UPI0013697BEA|nr:hypothetical protein [Streptomyces sp. SID3343]MYW05939.1 hypothetical protein [Streptomyces sp. SID3343]